MTPNRIGVVFRVCGAAAHSTKVRRCNGGAAEHPNEARVLPSWACDEGADVQLTSGPAAATAMPAGVAHRRRR
jgi:hypothetical protein